MKHILAPTDFSTASRNACKYAASLTKDFGAKITLLHVFDTIPGHIVFMKPLFKDRLYSVLS